MSDQEDQPSLTDVLEETHDAWMNEVHTSQPGRVKRYDPDLDIVDVEPTTRRAVLGVDGRPGFESLVTVRSVRIEWPGAGDWFMRWPLAIDSTGMIVCCERDFSRWAQTGDVGDPVDLESHSLSFAVFRPGLRPRTNALTGTVPGMVFGKRGGPTISIRDDGFVDIGGDAILKSANENVKDHLAAIAQGMDALMTAIALGVPTPQPNYGVAAKLVLDGSKPVAATKARVL